MPTEPMVKKSGSKCPAPEVHLLGEIVIAFGNLELFLELGIWQMLTPEELESKRQAVMHVMAQAITTGLSFTQKINAFASMFRERDSPALAESRLTELIKALTKAQDGRNRLLHSAWTYTDIWGDSSLMRMKASARAGGLKRGFFRMSAERIEETLREIEAATELLGHFTVDYIQPPEG